MGCTNIKENEIHALGFDFALEIKNKKHRIVTLGTISKTMLETFDINHDVVIFEGNLDKLTSIYNNN